MEILSYKQLSQGGFAGLKERRFVMDERVFGARKTAGTVNGLKNFVYLADANFLPNGSTGMHPHKEIDVISIMADGNVSHAGSLEHGQSLAMGQAQVQRAGGEGFSHNEINPDSKPNQLIQIWALPDKSGEKASYKAYNPIAGELVQIYGGKKTRSGVLLGSLMLPRLDLSRQPGFACLCFSGIWVFIGLFYGQKY